MKKPPLVASALVVRFGLVALFGAGLLTAQTPAKETPETAQEPQQLERFVVTGSYIPSAETAVDAGASPMVRIDRQIIEESGYTSTTELLQQITAANANSVPISNNATGFTPAASAIALRGLGPEAVLVLINGRRVAPYPVGVGGSTAFVDLNSIPLAAIDNIEVLKDGASALYGADAVAGVINIKLRRALDGSEALLSYGNTAQKDSHEVIANFATGRTIDKLSFIAGANYSKKAAILHRDRAYSATPPFLSNSSSPANLELTRFAAAAALNQPVSAPIAGVPNNFAFLFAQSGADSGNNGQRAAAQYTYSADRSSQYNFNESAMSYPAHERKGVFAFGERKILGTDNLKAYADFSYQDVRYENQLAPTATGDFTTPGRVGLVIPARTANPILTVIDPARGLIFVVPAGISIPNGYNPGPGTRIVAGRAERLAAPGAVNPFNPFNQDIADGSRMRLAEFGDRVAHNKTDAVMFSTGIKGENLAGKWNFDASFSYSSMRDQSSDTLVSASRFNEVLNANSAVFDPRSPAYIGVTTPYNPFGYYRSPIPANSALVRYAGVTARSTNESSLGHANFVVSTTDLWRLPHGSVGFAFGSDYRREQLHQNVDPRAASGDLIGQSPTAMTSAQRKIGGLFGEVRVPVHRNLELNAALRHEKFFTSHREATVPKVALRYQLFRKQLTLRSSYSEGFREPSLFELYSSPISVLTSIRDPRTGLVEPEQQVTLRGNRRLTPEDTDYFNVGFVWSPTIPRFKGLSLGADFWALSRNGTVEANPQLTVYRAFGALPGGLIPGEAVLLSPAGEINAVNTVFSNLGQTKVEGWDFNGGYQLPTDTLGRWELTTVWTLITRFDRSALPGEPLVDVIGRDSTGQADNAYLEWKGRVTLRWTYKGFTTVLSGTYIDGFQDEDLSGAPFEVEDSIIAQAHVAYAFRNSHGARLRDTKLAIGVRNLFDRDPPQAFGGGRNPNGYPGSLYSAENQFWYATVSRRF